MLSVASSIAGWLITANPTRIRRTHSPVNSQKMGGVAFPVYVAHGKLDGSSCFMKHTHVKECPPMAKPHRVIKKANHGKRPAGAKARKAKRRLVRT